MSETETMPHPSRSRRMPAALWALASSASVACGSPPPPGAPAAPGAPPVTHAACALTNTAEGWATVHDGGSSQAPSGGAAADAAHVYEVTTRRELVLALFPDAVIANDGSFTSAHGPDATPKLIRIHGTISLNANAAGVEQTEADYACIGYDFAAYTALYDPTLYNRQALVNAKPPELPRCPAEPPTLEALRICSSQRQRRVVMIPVGSNTSLIGVGTDAQLVHGTLLLGPAPQAGPDAPACAAPAAGVPAPPAAPRPGPDNVVIRNITFEDAFDFFPAWDPTDDYAAPPARASSASANPGCQASHDAATGNGPQQCPGGRWNSLYDNLSLIRATHVWIDHCTFSDGDRQDDRYPSVWRAPYIGRGFIVQHHDGLVDVTSASDLVTLSYNVFRNHDKTTLIGGSDRHSPDSGLGTLRVTVHHNRYENLGQRMPRVRFGKVHTYDNYVTGTLLPREERPNDTARGMLGVEYAVGIGYLAKIYSENNVYELRPSPGDAEPDESAIFRLLHKAPPTAPGPFDRDEATYFYDQGSLLNGRATALFVRANASAARGEPPKPPLLSTDTYWTPSSVYNYTLTPAAEVPADVTAHAGVCRDP